MMKSRILITGILFALCSGILAQEKYNSLGLSLGMGSLVKQDLIFSPFVNKDWSPLNLMVSFERSRKLEQQVYLKFAQYTDHLADLYDYQTEGSTYPKYPHTFVMLDLNYSLGKTILMFNQWQFTLGGRFRNRIQMSNYDYGSAGSFGYHIPIGLDAWFSARRQLGEKHCISTNLYVPVFSYVARSPYMGQDDEYLERISVHGDLKILWEHIKSGQIQSWGTSKLIDFNLGYQYFLSERWSLGASYWFSMNHHSSPVKHNAYENVIYLSTTFNF